MNQPVLKKARITFEVEPDVKRKFKGFCGAYGYEMKEVLEQAVLDILSCISKDDATK